ncbi:unnamed protein product [Linum trigynum]|uniref:Myb/SANT-like domain-containing protein n=1 Tax=Linum trigynum TaxID=586398 RepID=A0AAV2C8S1_9ROSI
MRKKKAVVAAAGSRSYTYWDNRHDAAFLECLLELTEKGQIEAGTCKNGVFYELEHMMEMKVPGCGVKAKPTIMNRIKRLKNWYHATVLMRNQSGFGWDVENSCIDAHKDVWEPFIQKNPTCKSFNRVPFPQFFDLAPIFANGRATGDMGFSGNDPQILSESGSDDDEETPIMLDEMNSPATDEVMANIINDGVEARAKESRKRPAAPSAVGPSDKRKKGQYQVDGMATGSSDKKKKGQAVQADDGLAAVTTEMKDLTPLIKQSVDTIASALGQSEEHHVMRRDLMKHLDELEGLSTVQKVLVFRRLNNNPSDLKSFYDLDKENKLTLVLDILSP